MPARERLHLVNLPESTPSGRALCALGLHEVPHTFSNLFVGSRDRLVKACRRKHCQLLLAEHFFTKKGRYSKTKLYEASQEAEFFAMVNKHQRWAKVLVAVGIIQTVMGLLGLFWWKS